MTMMIMMNQQLLFPKNMMINLTEDMFETAATLYVIHIGVHLFISGYHQKAPVFSLSMAAP